MSPDSPSHEDPIAVCGLSLKFPQDATSEKSFWEMLMDKRNAMTEYPRDRVNIDAFYHPTRRDALKTRGAHFIKEDLGLFDANFFSLTPSEASAMDPMQRILLETTYKAFENAGMRLENLRGSRTSVHTGCFTNDYLQQILKDSERLPPYAAVGATQSMLANRLSWFYDLRGPSVNLDSACSSSAMAVDLSCQLLRNHVTNMGVVAGCNILLDPDFSTILSNMQMLSPDGQCFTFDHRANGYSRGEGVAVVVLKRLSDALRDNDSIRAVIRACGTNQDGRTPGITQPDPMAQAQLIRETYQRAGLSMRHTRFFEAHGTGTAIGDPIELGAIADCFHKHRNLSDPLYVGSVKTNIGHLEGASGLAGLIKAILVVESGVIPPNANFESINRKLASYDYMISLPSDSVAWPPCDVRRASINSFGYGGTNSHIVIDDIGSYVRNRGLVSNRRIFTHLDCRVERLLRLSTTEEYPQLLVWSAFTKTATQAMIGSWEQYCSEKLETKPAVALSDIAYTLDSRRTLLPSKSFAIISNSSDLRSLTKLASVPVDTPKQTPRLAFVFTGQGAQWYAMGRELLRYPKFQMSIRDSEFILNSFGCSWSLQEELLRTEKESNINRPDVSQSLTAVIQIALVDLLQFFGVTPTAVVGHSMGEIAAAYCAEFLTRESALRIAYYRGFFTASIPERSSMKGAMLAVALSAEEISTYFDVASPATTEAGFGLVISCINSPCNTTVSGDEIAIGKLKEILDNKGIFARRLRVPVAYHSPQMDLIVSDCLRYFTGLVSTESRANIKMVSSVTGEVLTKERACQPSYWTANMVNPVLFSQAVERLCRDSIRSLRHKIDSSHREAIVVDHLVEIGPHAALQLPIREITTNLARGKYLNYLSALYRKQSASVTLLRLLGQLHCSGLYVNLRRVNDPHGSEEESRVCLVDAPEYPFDHSRRYWSESPLVRNYRLRSHGHVELLGSPGHDWNPLAPHWRCHVQLSDIPWLVDHALNGKVIYPASAMVVMAIQGVEQISQKHQSIIGFTLRDVQFKSAITIPSDAADLETRLQLRPLGGGMVADNSAWIFSVYSVTAGNWVENCCGTVEVQYDSGSWREENKHRSRYYQRCLTERRNICEHSLDPSAIYNNFTKSGFHYGPTFQGITGLCHNGTDTVTARLDLGSPLSAVTKGESFIIHPGSLDSFFHLALVSLRGFGDIIPTQAISRIDKLWISANGLSPSHECIQASARLEQVAPRRMVYSGMSVTENEDNVKILMEGLQTTVIATVDKSEELIRKSQYWCQVRMAVDVEVLSSSEVVKYLDQVCGPDPIGPGEFFSDLRLYLCAKIRKFRKVVEETGIDTQKPYLERYVRWMNWHISTPSMENLCETRIELLRTRISQFGFLGEFFLKVADNAVDVLQGRSDMVQLIFEDNLVERFYEEFLTHSPYYEKFQTYLENLSFKYPDMNFLEIGAGTGSFTEHILKAVSSTKTGARERLGRYCYTDISPAFFERARTRFSTYTHKMDFAVLNAELDPLEQGFQKQTFDMVAASNVLHVTNDLDRTLQGLRKLLKPGGKLFLHEYIHPERIEVGFVFGLLPGWWPDDESRIMSPLCSVEVWDQILRRNGFSGADFALRDFADEESHLMSIICATATEFETVTPELPAITIAIESGSSIQSQAADLLFTRLSDGGFQVARMELSAPESVPVPGVVVTLFDLETAILSRLDRRDFESLKSLLLSASSILWVTQVSGSFGGPSYGMIDGFSRVFRIENINAKLATLALERNSRSLEDSLSFISVALQQLLKSQGLDHPEDYIVQNGMLNVGRLYEDTSFKAMMSKRLSGERQITKSIGLEDPIEISFQNNNSHETPRITESYLSGPLGDEEVEIQVKAIGLNAVDVSAMSGENSGFRVGRECSGVVTSVGKSCNLSAGDRVCAYGTDVCRSTCRVNRNLVAKIPDSISFEEASSFPQDYIIACYLAQHAGIKQDDVVLVCGGDTRLGKATLDVLREYSPNLCATVSVVEHGQDTCFQDIRRLSEPCLSEYFRSYFPNGANLILDFLNTDIRRLTECVAKFGQLLRVRTSDDHHDRTQINLFELPSTVSFRGVNVEEVLKHQFDRLAMPVTDLNQILGMNSFPLRKIDVSSISQVATLMKTLQGEERIAIALNDQSQIQVYQSASNDKLFDGLSSYVISGGLGDLGRCIATWMVRQGARYLILLSRSGPSTEKAKATVRELEQLGAKIFTPRCDVADCASLRKALEQTGDIPAIKGCIQAAGSLKDIMYEKMNFDDWKVAVDPKVNGSWNLHELLPNGMDFFIMVSSISGTMGQATQANYASGNTYQDSLAKYRHAIGEKAVSLDLGILATGGLLSQNEGLAERLAAENVYTVLSEPEILALFEHFCDPQLSLEQIPSQIISGFINPSLQDRDGTNFPPAFCHPYWSQTLIERNRIEEVDCNTGGITNISRSLAESGSVAEVTEIVASALAHQISSLVMTPRASINMEEPLHTAGADSLSAVYLRNWIMKQFSVDVAVFDILGEMSIVALGASIANEWQAAKATV